MEVVASAYQVRGAIAEGDDDATFDAWDLVVERPVALKLAWRDAADPPLLVEARRIASVRDPAAVTIFAVGNHRGAELVVAERVAGRTAAEVARGAAQPMPDVELIDVVLRAARGVAAAHAVDVTLGEVSGDTVLIDGGRVVLGAVSLSQVPAATGAGSALAPELITRQRDPSDPGVQAAVDVYGLGCLAVELATGRPPYLGDSIKATLFGHVHHRPPVLAELRADLPVELGDLVAELLDKRPEQRPPAAAVAAQLSAIGERVAATRRTVRVLIVDDDADRVRAVWSVLRRAHPRATVDAARDGADAVGKLRRDRPDLVVIDARLAGTMNALELCMYVSGLEDARGAVVAAIVDDVDSADTGVLSRMGAHHVLARDGELAASLAELVRAVAVAPRFGSAPGRITVSG
jgi:CheY-like chemotaxis protein